MDNQIPKWILIVSGLIGLLAVTVGCSLYLTPGAFIPNVDFSDAQLKYLSNMWAARQISVGFILLFSIFSKSVPMLKVSLIAYALMNLQDIFIGVTNGDNSLIIGATIFFLLPVFIIFKLNRK
ncbi:MAG: hypothetical protein O2887_13515 [Bacteroidetes bacterium]|nr:hypothetical protein [Bacteroidota bacterium]MDA1121490.1 hypothetical protein [Bacteroidota bacterium]